MHDDDQHPSEAEEEMRRQLMERLKRASEADEKHESERSRDTEILDLRRSLEDN